MQGIYKNILSNKQLDLLELISVFSNQFYLVEGTAIALQIGHRQSIDFDLFTNNNIKPYSIKNNLIKNGFDFRVIYEEFEQLHLLVNNVKITFFNYPFKIITNVNFNGIINIPSLLTLAAMKAYALGGRAKWKDYVDLYFILRDHFTTDEIENEAVKIFENKFNAKLFRQQLAYFKDIDYSEKVIFVKEEPDEKEIRDFLMEKATSTL